MTRRDFLRPNILIACVILAAVSLAAVLAPVIATHHPTLDANLLDAERPPDHVFLLGSDEQGRDVFSRIVYGGRVSILIGLTVQAMNSVIGVLLGLSSGYFGGRWDEAVQGLTNLMMALPTVVFALALMVLMGPGVASLLVALGTTDWAYSCRISRAMTLSLKTRAYVRAAEAAGHGPFHVMLRELLPNMTGPLVVVATMGVGSAIMAEASLSFLGLGVTPDTPSWGSMLAHAREQLSTAPWVAIFPGLALFLTVLALNLLGDGLRDLFDPARRGGRA
jgi:peptide/nickel transport system permease protein